MTERHPFRVRRATHLALALAAGLILVLAGCFRQNTAPDSGSTHVEIVEAHATSSTSFLLRFSGPLGEGADVAANYRIRDPDGGVLPVLAAHVLEGGQVVVLATEPQRDVRYAITVHGMKGVADDGAPTDELGEIVAPEEVAGSTVTAPALVDAVALSNTSVLLRFGDPGSGNPVEMNDDALATSAYRTKPKLDILDVAFGNAGDDRSEVLLTTAPMEDVRYELQVGRVTSGDPPTLLDPVRTQRPFFGIAPVDDAPPELLEAYATGARTVLARFSEPLHEGAADAGHYVIRNDADEAIEVRSAQLGPYGTRVTLSTGALEPGVAYTLSAHGLRDLAGNERSEAATAAFAGVGEGSDGRAPRVTGATSTAPTRVLVAFSEPVRGGMESAENPEHYDIVGSATLGAELSAQAIVDVTDAQLAGDGRSVTLTTLPQSEIAYTLRVTNVSDADGNTIVGASREHPFEIEFFGTAESEAGVDSDGDGLTDAAEQRGWIVRIVEADGSTSQREVTSDPFSLDTDEDGVRDDAEKVNRTDPRAADSDGDDLTDARELNETYSSPVEVDSDGDGLGDGLEVDFFDTSPRTADTDGDQFTDDYEVDADNRNPRIADLPIVEIDVGNVDLQLDVRFEEQTSEGTSTVDATSVSTTLERSESSRSEEVNTDTDEWFINAATSFCYLAGCDQDTFAVGGTVSLAGGFTRTSTTTTTNESARASQEAYERSMATEASVSAEASITRIVEGATMAVAVTLTNPGNVAYTVRDLEITALTQDGRNAASQIPIATLTSESGGEIHIGPLNPTRGPFRFEAREAFPNLVEQLMQNPRGITFKVANYTLEDELGRRFAFVQQDVNDRTAGFKINYAGNRALELYQVATNATFTPDGRTTGVSMASVLEGTLGLEHVPAEEDAGLDPTVRADAERIDRSYSTRVIGGVEVLHRVRDVSRDLTGEDRDWRVFVYQGRDSRLITPVDDNPGEDFRSVTVRAEADFGFYFVQDLDGDALQKSVESSYGSVDSATDDCDNALFGVVDPDDHCPGDSDGTADSRDTDRDGIGDNTELRGPFVGNDYRPWRIRFDDGRDGYRTSANPARWDTDGDGLSDCQELVPTQDGTTETPPLPCSTITVYFTPEGEGTLDASSGDSPISFTLPSPTDPAAIDTDGDGLSDLDEVLGFRYEGLAGALVEVRPDANGPATNPLSRDDDDDGLDDRSEIRLGTDPTVPDGETVFDDDGDGLVNVEETTPRTITVHDGSGAAIAGDDADDASNRTTTSDQAVIDTDGDGLTDWEEYRGCRDADRDLACDAGVPAFGPTGSSAGDDDTDRDGLSDREEVDGVAFTTPSGATALRYPDPVDGDSDDDGRSDGEEIDEPWSVVVDGRAGYLAWSDPMRADADGDGLSDSEELAHGTDPNMADTDGDGALDGLEVHRVDEGGEPLTDPLTPDHLVTVTFLSIEVGRGDTDGTGDGDGVDDAGDFDFRLGTVKPDPDTGLLEKSFFVTPRLIEADFGTCDDVITIETLCLLHEPGGGGSQPYWYIQVNSHPEAGGNVLGLGSYQERFAVPFTSRFAVWGVVNEVDPPFGSPVIDHGFSFGDLIDENATFAGKSLTKGTQAKVFTQSDDQDAYRVDVTVQITIE